MAKMPSNIRPYFSWLDDGSANGTEPEKDTNDPMQDVFENKNLIIQILTIKLIRELMKTDKGMEVLQTVAKEAVHGIFGTCQALAQASAANPVSAWANPVLLSGIYERMGMLPPAFNNGYHLGITVISGVKVGTTILEAIFGKEGAFPSVMNFSGLKTAAELTKIAAASGV